MTDPSQVGAKGREQL